MVFGLFRDRRVATGGEAAVEAQPVERAARTSEASPPALVRTGTPGPVLWQDVHYGMTEDEVVRSRPDAAAVANGQRLHDGAVSRLEIPRLDLADHSYSVLFYFRDGGLTQVTFATNGGPTRADFLSIANALRLRYGREVEFADGSGSFSTGEWLSPDGVNVALVFHEEIGCLNINFQYRYADAAMRL